MCRRQGHFPSPLQSHFSHRINRRLQGNILFHSSSENGLEPKWLEPTWLDQKGYAREVTKVLSFARMLQIQFPGTKATCPVQIHQPFITHRPTSSSGLPRLRSPFLQPKTQTQDANTAQAGKPNASPLHGPQMQDASTAQAGKT